jgi:hypothetical protein
MGPAIGSWRDLDIERDSPSVVDKLDLPINKTPVRLNAI